MFYTPRSHVQARPSKKLSLQAMPAKPLILKAAQKRFLRQQAHHLNPVVRIGDQGLHEGVIKELDIALEFHELIKLKVTGQEREDKRAMIADIEEKLDCACVQLIGHVAIIYRAAKEPTIVLPKS